MAAKGKRTFVTEPPRAKCRFENRYLRLFGDTQERRVDLPGLSPALIQKRQELEEVQQQLATDRLNYEHWLKDHQQRKIDLEQKMTEFEHDEETRAAINERMRGDIQKFKVLAEREYESAMKYENQLAALNAREEEIRRRLSDLMHELEILTPSADFIEKVVSETKIFETPDAIIQRYETLMSCKNDRMNDLRTRLGVSGKFCGPRERIAYLQSALVERRHELRLLCEEIARHKQDDRYLQITVTKAAERSMEKEIEQATIHTSIENMCRQTLFHQSQESHRDLGVAVPDSVEDQLEIVKQRFLDLRAVMADPELPKSTEGQAADSPKATTKPLRNAHKMIRRRAGPTRVRGDPAEDVF
jgi:DNA repair exonuclease SbcCD ATPase subunit